MDEMFAKVFGNEKSVIKPALKSEQNYVPIKDQLSKQEFIDEIFAKVFRKKTVIRPPLRSG